MRNVQKVSVCSFLVCLMLLLFAFTIFRTSPYEFTDHDSIRLTELDAQNDTNISLLAANKKRKNIFFLKAHKCGSSTVQNILLRYGRDNKLTFLLPSEKQINYIGNPTLFHRNMIDESVRSVDNVYNVFTHHTRYNPEEVKAVMKSDAVFVTILRDPATLFESMYNFYKLHKRLNVSFQEFLENTEDFEDKLSSRHNSRYGRNQMCYDLGLDENRFSSDQYVDDFIKMIDQDFDLVMISEHMEASLILLANLMGWSLQDIRFLKNNARQAGMIANLTETDKDKLRHFNNADTKLYNHFSDVFKAKIKAYGVDKMMAQMQDLISLNCDLHQLCVDQVNTFGYGKTYSYSIRKGAPMECIYAGQTELSFTKQLRAEQMQKLEQLRKFQDLMST